MRKREVRAICKKCGWSTEAPDESLHQVVIPACPKCGNIKQGFGSYFPNWGVAHMEWDNYASVWCKPWTWGSGEWKRIQIYDKEWQS